MSEPPDILDTATRHNDPKTVASFREDSSTLHQSYKRFGDPVVNARAIADRDERMARPLPRHAPEDRPCESTDPSPFAADSP